MKVKDRAELFVKEAELIYKKLLVFLAVASGSWVYGVMKLQYSVVFQVIAYVVFFISMLAIIANLIKYGAIQKQLREILDGNFN